MALEWTLPVIGGGYLEFICLSSAFHIPSWKTPCRTGACAQRPRKARRHPDSAHLEGGHGGPSVRPDKGSKEGRPDRPRARS